MLVFSLQTMFFLSFGMSCNFFLLRVKHAVLDNKNKANRYLVWKCMVIWLRVSLKLHLQCCRCQRSPIPPVSLFLSLLLTWASLSIPLHGEGWSALWAGLHCYHTGVLWCGDNVERRRKLSTVSWINLILLMYVCHEVVISTSISSIVIFFLPLLLPECSFPNLFPWNP